MKKGSVEVSDIPFFNESNRKPAEYAPAGLLI